MTAKITDLLQQLERERFYGTVSFQLKAGQVEIIRKEETIRPQYEGKTYASRNVQK